MFFKSRIISRRFLVLSKRRSGSGKVRNRRHRVALKKGCVEKRRLWVDSVCADWIRSALGVPNCRSIFCVERTSSQAGVKPEVRYFISSLSLSDKKPEEILSLIRDHWLIENGLHFVKDRWRDEDRHYLSMPGLGERFTCLLNRVVSIAGLLKRGKEPLTAVAALVRDKPKKFLKRLGFLK